MKRLAAPLLTTALLLTCSGRLDAQEALFRRADANADGAADMADGLRILELLFISSEAVSCRDALDVNDDGRINIGDPIALLRHLFLGAAVVPPPFEACGADTTADALDCESHPPCEDGEVPCLSEPFLAEILGPLPGLEFCLPSGLIELSTEALEISVCPANAAPECGLLGTAGCPIEITSLTPFYEPDTRSVGLRVEGHIEELPVDVTGGILNTTSTCLLTLRGGDPAAPFFVDLLIPLEADEVEPGVFEVIGTGEGQIGELDLDLDVGGEALLCQLLNLGDDLLQPLLLSPLELAVATVSESIREAVVGLQICE